MKKLIGMAVVGLWAVSAISAVKITNLSVTQRPGTKLVDITYSVSSDVTNLVSVSVTVSNGTEAVNAVSLSGDIGAGVFTGTGKRIVWDAGADWSGHMVSGIIVNLEVLDGSEIACPAGGDPSAVVWEVVNDRWVKNIYVNGDVTMSDRTTGRMWCHTSLTYGGTYPLYGGTWSEAVNYCNNLTYAGYSDWRLPNKDILQSQYSQKDFFGGASGDFWSSTAYYTSQAYGVNMQYGYVYIGNKTAMAEAWPVRGP